jgi:hypothetical protein
MEESKSRPRDQLTIVTASNYQQFVINRESIDLFRMEPEEIFGLGKP